MNNHEKGHAPKDEARLEYSPVEFRLVSAGSFVRCAVTGKSIPLEDLRYWSVAFQEPYASPEAVMTRINRIQAKHL